MKKQVLTVGLIAALVALTSCAPTPKPSGNMTKKDLMEQVEFCYYEGDKWMPYSYLNSSPMHVCYEITDRAWIPATRENMPYYRMELLRDLYEEYGTNVKRESGVWSKCYYEIGDYKKCKNQIRKTLPGIGWTPRSLKRLRDLWSELADKEPALVRHCFFYHQTRLIEQCRGISWDRRPEVNSDRNNHLMDLWVDMEKERDSYIKQHHALNESKQAQIDLCLYDTQWRENSNHICWLVTNMVPLEAAPDRLGDAKNIKSMQVLYEDAWEIDQMKDCYVYHQKDRYIDCYELSWNLDSVEGKKPFEPYGTWHKRLWDMVVSGSKNQTMNAGTVANKFPTTVSPT